LSELRFDIGLFAFGIAIAALLLGARSRTPNSFGRALPSWAAAVVALAAGGFLIALGSGPGSASATLAGKSLVAAAHAAFVHALLLALGRRPGWAGLCALLVPVALVFGLSLALVMRHPEAPLRSGLLSLLMAGYAGAAIVALAADGASASRSTRVALLTAFSIAGGAHLVRAMLVIDFPEFEARWPTATHDLLLVSTLAMVGASVAFALAASHRTQDDFLALANRDELTGIPNRRAFNRIGERLLERCRRQNQPISALVIDIDHFKRINDQFGHAEGDRVLVRVAGAIAAAVSSDGIVARVGGEEFFALLPDRTLTEARETAERVRGYVASLPGMGGPGLVTVSIGVAATEPTDLDLEALVERADAALLAAKSAGRNRTMVAAAGGAVPSHRLLSRTQVR
jgi:diguanylate cyclase (GGDEF)-like protein